MSVISPLQADVVCRQLGYSGASDIYFGSHFGQTPDIFSYDDLYCTGSEFSLDECPHSNEDNCNGFEAAGVVCGGGSSTTTTIGTTTTTQDSSPAGSY